MGPKKPAAKKEEKPVVEEDDMTVPCNEVNFKINIDCKHEGGHYLKPKFNWIKIGEPGTAEAPQTIETEQIDTGFMKDWTLVQIEGEEPAEEVPVDPKAAAKGKAAPAKGGKGAPVLEEITDNRPREIKYEKVFQDDGLTFKISEEVAKYFETYLLAIEIWSTDRETQEETFLEKQEMDLSQLLFETEKEKVYTWKFDKMKTVAIHYLNFSLSVDVPLLNPFLRNKLNPLQVNLIECKDIPYKTEPNYKPIYGVFNFVDGRSFRTLDFPQDAKCKFRHKHVFLVGHMDAVSLKESLTTKVVSVDLHDCDEYVQDEENAAFSYGRAKFSFRDFLRKNCLEVKLRSDVFPLKRNDKDNTTNLDLNTTAKKGEKTVERANPYLTHSTAAILVANLARPIGNFDHDVELKKYKEHEKALKRLAEATEGEGKETTIQSSGTVGKKTEQQTATIETAGDKQTIDSQPELVSQRVVVKDAWDPNDAIYERMIIIIPYKSPDTVKQIEDSFEKVNLKGLNLPNVRYLSTKDLTEEERKDRRLDFIGGFCLMDSETRMYILEGLGGEGKGMNEFYQDNMRQRPNDRKYTMLYNPDVRFKNRIYVDFNCSIKKIKLREPLRSIMGAPDVYLRSKVPQDMFHILQQFAEIRKLTRLSLVRDFNLFPVVEKLLILERKYGDSISIEDLTGRPAKPKKKKVFGQDPSQTDIAATQKTTQPADSQVSVGQTTVQNSGLPPTGSAGAIKFYGAPGSSMGKRKAETDCKNEEFEITMKQRKAAAPKDFQVMHRRQVRSMQSGRPLQERLNIPEEVDVFQYAGQKLNIWEFQKEQLRQQISRDPTKFYTYSAEHLSLAFPIVNENEIAQKEKEQNEARWKTKKGFDNVMKRQNWNEHPKKPPQSVLENLQIPYHLQAEETKQQLKGFQYNPEAVGKPDFRNKIKIQGPTFSNKEYFNTVFISGDDMVAEEAAMKAAELEAFNKKVVVDNQHFYVNTLEKKKQFVSQADKYKNIREEMPNKVGLRYNKKRLAQLIERQILTQQEVGNPPVSMLKEEEYQQKDFRPPYKPFDKTRTMSLRQMDTNIHSKYLEKYGNKMQREPRSNKVFIKPLTAAEKQGPRWGNNRSVAELH